MSECIFHIDVNSAYLSWTAIEKLKRGSLLDLRTVPSIIGGDEKSRHGVVLAKSIPAKKYRIHTGEPVATALRKYPNLIIEPPDHKLYREYSRKLMTYLHTLTSDIEQVSIDECYLNFEPIANQFSSAEDAAFQIRKHIREQFGFTVNIGISSRKVLAKMASDFEKPDRTHTLFPEEIYEKMWPLPVNVLFMVGKSSAAKLRSMGIHTIGELAQTDLSLLKAVFKKHGQQMWEYANGIDNGHVNSQPREAKGIGNSITLPKDASDRVEIDAVLFSLAETVSSRLRNAGRLAGTVTTEVKYNTFRSASKQMQLLSPTNSSRELYNVARTLMDQLWNGTPVRLLGIRTSKLSDCNEPIQLSIFDIEQPSSTVPASEKLKKLDQALDTIRKRFGPDAVTRASCLEEINENNKKHISKL